MTKVNSEELALRILSALMPSESTHDEDVVTVAGIIADALKPSAPKIPPVSKGYNRQWLKCKECGKPFYYDYIPRSLASPVMWLPCGHSDGDFRDSVISITTDDALAYFAEHS